jgi:diguanylate cyclase (GGDEF)-like protein
VRPTTSTLLPGGRADRVLIAFGAGTGVFLLCYLAALLLRAGGETGLNYLSNLFYHVPLVVAVTTLSLAATRSSGVLRTGWVLAAAGVALLAAGEMTWSVYDWILGREVPLPSVADGFYYPGDILLIAAIALLVMPGSSGKSTWRSLVDGLLVAISLATLSWVFVLEPTSHAEGLDNLGLATTLGYPLMDLVMIIVVVAALYRSADCAVSVPVFLLGVGTVAIAASDTLYVHLWSVQGYDPTGNPVEFGWVAGYAIFALAGAVQARYGDADEPVAIGLPAQHSAASFALPYFISLPVLAILAVTAFSGETDPVIATGACLLVGGIAVRQWITILELRDREGQVRHLAYHDPLTDLPNRALLEDRAQQAIAFARRHGGGLAVLSLDLDGFKLVNDARGHIFGDKLLRAVSVALRSGVRDSDTVARVGGDEFVILMTGIGSVLVCSAVAQKLSNAVNSIEIDGQPFPARVSIGASLFPNDGKTMEELWSRADAAMYEAKQAGRDRVQSRPGNGRRFAGALLPDSSRLLG